MLAKSLESLLHPEHVKNLTGSPQDIENEDYIITKQSLIRLAEEINPVYFAYILGNRNGDLIFLVDSELPDDPDYAPPGLIYEEADDIYREPFRTGNTVLTKSVFDRWGRWISVLVPIKDEIDGRVLAVLGLDYSAKEWNIKIWSRMVPDFIISVGFLLLFIALFVSLTQRSALRKLSRQLALDEALYRSIFEQAPIGIAIVNNKNFVKSSDFSQSNINPVFEKILGRTSRDLDTVDWAEITHPDDLEADLYNFSKFKKGEIDGYTMEKRFLRPDGSFVWTNMKISPLLNVPRKHSMHLCLLEDITARKKIEENLMESERSKAVLLSNIPGLAYRCLNDESWTMLYVSEGCRELTGYAPDSLTFNKDISFNDLITPEYRAPLREKWNSLLPNRQSFEYEYEITTFDGNRKWVLELGQGIYDENGQVQALEGIVLDISERKLMEDQLKYNSEHDAWTGLYNRNHLYETYRHDLRSHNQGRKALIGINLSAIHTLSVTYGFRYSQDLLKKVAETLKSRLAANIQLFYVYENRFIFYMKSYNESRRMLEFCEALAGTLQAVLAAEKIGGSIGVVETDGFDEADIEEQFKKVLFATEQNFGTMKKDIEIFYFDEGMHSRMLREEAISRELSRIAAGNCCQRLYLQFQPIFDLGTDAICGFEALARLKSDEFGTVPPAEFIPISEKSKLIIPLGDEVIRQALSFAAELESIGKKSLTVSINISAIQLLREGFTHNLRRMMEERGINPESIYLEITESVFASDFDAVNGILAGLKGLGLSIAIDDFGTKYSSLARERELNVDCIKIDKYFLDKLMVLDPAQSITQDIISMAHRLGHCVIAEGVEHEAQRRYLKEQGCDKIQGYLVGRPLDRAAAIGLLAK